jgi:hypothetical protein
VHEPLVAATAGASVVEDLETHPRGLLAAPMPAGLKHRDTAGINAHEDPASMVADTQQGNRLNICFSIRIIDL